MPPKLQESESFHSCCVGRHNCLDSLRCIDCVPEHVKNDHILTGYRHNYSYWEATKSLFTLHNETFNVWSHILGIALFLFFLYSLLLHAPTIQSLLVSIDDQLSNIQGLLAPLHALSDSHASLLRDELHLLNSAWGRIRAEYMAGQTHRLCLLITRLLDAVPPVLTAAETSSQLPLLRAEFDEIHLEFSHFHNLITQASQGQLSHHLVPLWPLVAFIVGSVLCFLSSSLFHLFCAVGDRSTYLFFQKLDYAGISLILAGGYSPVMYYLYDLGAIRLYYLVAAEALALALIVFLLSDAAYLPAFRSLRVCLFLAYGFFSLVPFAHAGFVLSHDHPYFFSTVFRLSFMAFCLVLGATLFYLARLPERLASGRFDIWLQSHQLWHLSIILSAFLHYQVSYDLWRFAHYVLLSLEYDYSFTIVI